MGGSGWTPGSPSVVVARGEGGPRTKTQGMSGFHVSAEQAANASRESGTRIAADALELLDRTHDAILIRRIGGAIEYWNRGAEELYGYSRAEALGRVSHELLRSVFPLPLAEVEAHLARDGAWSGELTHVAKDGRKVVVDSRHVLLREADGTKVVFETNRDITARKAAEEALRASEARYRGLADLTPAGMYACDAAGRITFFNQRAAELWGRAPRIGDADEQFCGSHRLYRPDGSPLTHADTPMAKAIRSAMGCRNEEVVIERPDGTRIVALVNIEPILDANGQPAGAVNTFLDITARKHAEDELRESEARLAAILDALPIGVAMVDQEGRMQVSNSVFRSYAPEYMPSRDEARHGLWEGYGADGRRLARTDYPGARALRGERVWPGQEFLFHGREGGPVWTRVAALPFRNQQGDVVGATGVIVDIDAEKRAEEALRESQARLAADMAAMERLQRISMFLMQEDRIEAICGHILDAAVALTGSDCASIQTYDSGSASLKLVGSRGFHPEAAQFWERVEAASASTCGVALRGGERVVVADVDACEYMAGTGDLDAYRKSGIRAVQSTPLVSRSGAFLGMISTHWREPHEPSARDLRLLDVLARQAADVIERAQSNEALVESRRRLNAVLDNASVSVFVMDERQQCIYMNAAAEAMTGYTLAETQGRPLHDVVHHTYPDGRPYPLAECPIDRAFPENNREQGEEVFVHKDGSFYPVAFTASPIRDEVSRIIGTIIEVRDIRAEKAAAEQIRLMLGELSHRSKNLLAVVQAMIRQTARGAESMEAFQEQLGDRIGALADAHDLLVSQNWEGAPIRDLVERQLSPFVDAQANRVSVVGPDLFVSTQATQSFALAIHELATNASKYGALSREGGRISVSWAIEVQPGGNRRFSMTWQERGGPKVAPPARRGFGSFVLERMVGAALNGQSRLEHAPDGLVWTLDSDHPAFLRE